MQVIEKKWLENNLGLLELLCWTKRILKGYYNSNVEF